jgi:uncharacterized protein YndB with AHSA1/START domain
MAERFGATIHIDRPIAEVFAYLADGENDKRFSSRIVEIARTVEGEPGGGVGTVYASTAKDAGFKAKHEFKITELEAPTRIRWTEVSKSPVAVPVGGYDLAAAGDGTELTFFNELEGHGIGKLIAGFALRSARKQAQIYAESIKRAVESS